MKKSLFVRPLFQALPIVALLGLSTPALSAEFIYTDLLGNSLPSQKCSAEDQAKSRANSEYELARYSKAFCQTQGYGWYFEERKNDGKLVCNECSEKPGQYQCHLEDIHVTCKRLKPGSTGLFPGRG